MKKYQIFLLSMIFITTSQLSVAGQEKQSVPAIPVLRATRTSGDSEKTIAITFKDKRSRRPITKNYESEEAFACADPQNDPFKRAYLETQASQNQSRKQNN